MNPINDKIKLKDVVKFAQRDENGKIAASGIEGIIRKFNDIYIAIFKIEKTPTLPVPI